MSGKSKHQSNKAAGVLDFFVVLFCLCGAGASLYLFQSDLFSTMRSFSALPTGIVSVKYNTVQRRFKDRMIWDRLSNESPVYNGDMIRVARLSGAVITIDNNSIELGENTLIRIQKDGETSNIDFFSGEVNVRSTEDSGMIFLTIGDKVVQAPSGTAFGASSSEEGVVLRVTEGTAQIVKDGQVSSAPAGTVIIQDAQGNELRTPAAAVIQPPPNARYLKTQDALFNLRFEWSRINMQRADTIRLEIAEDRNFARVRHVLDNLDSSAVAEVSAGLWNWRLLYENTVLASGRVTVTEAAAPTLHNAVVSGPDAQMRWDEVDEASGYLVQISQIPGFINPAISTIVQSAAFIMPDVDVGTWYWRVRPIFSSAYEGTAAFSPVSTFQVEKKEELQPLSLNMPVNESIIIMEELNEGIYFSWSNSRDAVSYTIQISPQSGSDGNIIRRTVTSNYFVYDKNTSPLVPGRYNWSVTYSNARGDISPSSQTRSFLVTQREINQRLVYPPDRFNIESGQISTLRFSWETNLLNDRRLQISAREDFSSLEVDAPVGENFYQGVSLPSGEWYWRVSARQSSISQAVTTLPRRFTYTAPAPVLPAAPAQVAAAPPLVEGVPAPQVPAANVSRAVPTAPTASVSEARQEETTTPPTPLRLRLVSPSNGTSIAGLTALRQPIVFVWESSEEIASSRFILSRNENPTQGRPEVEILNPGRSVTVNSLGEGLWYWTVIAQSRDGRPITSVAVGQIRVQPIPLLSSPGNMQPVNNYSIGEQELRQQRNIVFSWDAVEGANSYALSIYKEGPTGRSQIFRSEAIEQLNFTLENLSIFDYTGTYVWQIEAQHLNNQGVAEQHGRPGENTFTLNVPRPGRVETRDTGILYGN